MLQVLAIPAFEDNYLWLIHDGISAAVVDPGQAAPVVAALNAHQLSLVAILLTHHHADHVGGVAELTSRFDVPVYGPGNEKIQGISFAVHQGNTVTLAALSLELSVLNVPGHTSGHIAYHAEKYHWLFCGDTLFAGGCGRLFEGTPTQMMESLAKLAALPDQTQVYCAHEYTVSNLRFALEVEPDNLALRQRMLDEQEKRRHGKPTIPSTIGIEKQTNPFLRCREPAIVQRLINEHRVKSSEPIAVFTALREWKNHYR